MTKGERNRQGGDVSLCSASLQHDVFILSSIVKIPKLTNNCLQ